MNTITTIQMLVAAISKANSGSCRRITTSRMRSRRLSAYQKGITAASLAANKAIAPACAILKFPDNWIHEGRHSELGTN